MEQLRCKVNELPVASGLQKQCYIWKQHKEHSIAALVSDTRTASSNSVSSKEMSISCSLRWLITHGEDTVQISDGLWP